MLAETLIVVLETGSFTSAAEKLGISQSTVSRRIAALETQLGGKSLINRGTPTIDLAENVKAYVNDIKSILSNLDTADARIKEQDLEPSGLLRISIPPALGRAKLAQPLAKLLQLHPKLKLKIDFSDRYVDLRDREFDLVIRIKPLEQTGVHQIKLGESQLKFVGAPSYFKSCIPPKKITGLKAHTLIGFSSGDENDHLKVGGQKLNFTRNLPLAIFANDISAIYELVRAGYGISLLPDYITSGDLETGSLVRCVNEFNLPPLAIYALFPHDRRGSPNIEVTLETLKTAIL